MVFTTKEYGYFYQQYKQAEAEVTEWITSQCPPNPNGGEHCFSHLGELSRKLYNDKIEMPPKLREKLKHSVELRIKLLAHHREKGDANPEHEFAIVMMGKIAQALFPPSEIFAITKLMNAAKASTVATPIAPQTERSKSAPAAIPQWQQATSWRTKSPSSLQESTGYNGVQGMSQAWTGLRRGRSIERRRTV